MNENEDYSTLSAITECPRCGGKLRRGFSARYWSDERQPLINMIPESLKPALWTADMVPALKCETCGIAISDLMAPGYTPKSFLKKCINCGKDIPIGSEECQYCGAKQNIE